MHLEGQKKGKLNAVEPEGKERASLTLVGDVKYLGKRSLSDIHETVIRVDSNEQAGERDCNVHIFLPMPKYSSGAVHPQLLKPALLLRLLTRSDQRSPGARSRYEGRLSD